jgi:hypothetical protein
MLRATLKLIDTIGGKIEGAVNRLEHKIIALGLQFHGRNVFFSNIYRQYSHWYNYIQGTKFFLFLN